jgi:hypothetical protein
MNNISIFLDVLGKAKCHVDEICESKKSDYWDTISAIIIDKCFIEMVVSEMKDLNVHWEMAIKVMLSKCDAKVARLKRDNIREYIIEIKGACKFLLEIFGTNAAI